MQEVLAMWGVLPTDQTIVIVWVGWRFPSLRICSDLLLSMTEIVAPQHAEIVGGSLGNGKSDFGMQVLTDKLPKPVISLTVKCHSP